MRDLNCNRAFVVGGVKEAGLLAGALLTIGGIGFLILQQFHDSPFALSTAGVTVGIAASVLTGPITAVLTQFDISNRTFYVLWPTLVLPYWVLLGAAAGLIRAKTCASALEAKAPAPTKRDRRVMRWTMEVAAIVLAAFCFAHGPIYGPMTYGPRTSIQYRIINNLRQVDAAKQQLALENELAASYTPTEAEIAPYLWQGSNGIPRIGPERYVINPMGETPYAVLDSNWRFPRRGWREGYTITNGTEFRLPETARASGSAE